MGKVEIEASKLLVVTENHGGYLGGECLWCGAVGWMERLQHTPECPVPAAMKPPEPKPFAEFDAECIPGN